MVSGATGGEFGIGYCLVAVTASPAHSPPVAPLVTSLPRGWGGGGWKEILAIGNAIVFYNLLRLCNRALE